MLLVGDLSVADSELHDAAADAGRAGARDPAKVDAIVGRLLRHGLPTGHQAVLGAAHPVSTATR